MIEYVFVIAVSIGVVELADVAVVVGWPSAFSAGAVDDQCRYRP